LFAIIAGVNKGFVLTFGLLFLFFCRFMSLSLLANQASQLSLDLFFVITFGVVVRIDGTASVVSNVVVISTFLVVVFCVVSFTKGTAVVINFSENVTYIYSSSIVSVVSGFFG